MTQAMTCLHGQHVTARIAPQGPIPNHAWSCACLSFPECTVALLAAGSTAYPTVWSCLSGCDRLLLVKPYWGDADSLAQPNFV